MQVENPLFSSGKTGGYHTPCNTEPPRGGGGKPPTAWHGWSSNLPDTQMREAMPLVAVTAEYLSSRDLCPNYQRHLLRTAEKMEAFGLTSVAELEPQQINRWLASLVCSPQTRSNYRRQACTIVKAALGSESGHFIERIRRVKAPIQPPVAWTREELARLLHHARHLPGNLQSGCPAALFFTGWLLLGYGVGLRFSDLLGLRCHQIRDGRLHTVQSKTGEALVQTLAPECEAVLKNLSVLSKDGTIFRWALHERWLRIRFKRLCESAGVRGTPKWMRRTGATWVEATQPGQASRYLGHRSPELAMKHYVDKSLLPNSCPMPPRIAGQ